jgi:4,5-dihydroxyphthalate decarboxylase
MTVSTSSLMLKTAIGSYGYTQALKAGSLRIKGIEFEHTEFPEIHDAFRPMCRSLEFDICEMATTTYLVAKAYGKPFTALPLFVYRGFHHGRIVYNVKSGIKKPKDLEGRKVGMRAYTITGGVWARGVLGSEYGVDLNKVTWISCDEEHVSEYHKDAPANVVYQLGDNLAQMVIDGHLAAAITLGLGPIESPDIMPLIPDAEAAAGEYYRKTGVYPINNVIVIKDELLKQQPGLGPALFGAFSTAKERWLEHASEAERARPGTGDGIVEGDPLPFGLEVNRKAIETLIQNAYDQKILRRRFAPEEVFLSDPQLK